MKGYKKKPLLVVYASRKKGKVLCPALPRKSDLTPHHAAFHAVLEVEVGVRDWKATQAHRFNVDPSQQSRAPSERKLKESMKVERFVCNTVFLLKEAPKGFKPRAATIRLGLRKLIQAAM